MRGTSEVCAARTDGRSRLDCAAVTAVTAMKARAIGTAERIVGRCMRA